MLGESNPRLSNALDEPFHSVGFPRTDEDDLKISKTPPRGALQLAFDKLPQTLAWKTKVLLRSMAGRKLSCCGGVPMLNGMPRAIADPSGSRATSFHGSWSGGTILLHSMFGYLDGLSGGRIESLIEVAKSRSNGTSSVESEGETNSTPLVQA